MPVYVCNSGKGTIANAAKPKIAADITRIHCAVTGAPPIFVHVFFFEEAQHIPLNGKSAFVLGSIRSGRTDAQKAQIVSEVCQSVHTHTGFPLNDVMAITNDIPASWVMEGGDVMPEPGEEAEWLAAHGDRQGSDTDG